MKLLSIKPLIFYSFFAALLNSFCVSANANPDQYIHNQLSCEQKMAEYKWTKQQEHSSNQNSNQNYNSYKYEESLLQKSQQLLLSEMVLREYFGVEINQQLIQKELNRITSETQKPSNLKEIFELFNNDPQLIANCLGRPLIVQKKINHAYQWSKSIHESTRNQANFELEELMANDFKASPKTTFIDIIYTDTKENDLIDSQPSNGINSNEYTLIKLKNLIEHKEKIKLQVGLKESKTGFEYEHIHDEGVDYISVRKYIWKKTPLKVWLNQFNYSFSKDAITTHLKLNESDYYLNDITRNKEYSAHSDPTIYGNYWKNNYFIPQGANFHKAVWTGTEMIIWGGGTVGGKYNPVLETWSPITSINAPSDRVYSVAYWTGDEMLVWVGESDLELENDGALYDPITDTWRPISNIGAPQSRIYFSSEWTGEELVIWGGFKSNEGLLSSGFRYDLDADKWSPMSNLHTLSRRYKTTATYTGDEIIFWGGYFLGESEGYVNSGARYNLLNDSWQPMSSENAPSGRGLSYDVWTGTELLIWGGGNNNSANGYDFNDGAYYNPQTDTWRMMSQINAPAARSTRSKSVIWTGEELIVWGGSYYLGASNEGAKYNVQNDTWTSTSLVNAPTRRNLNSAIWTGNEMIIWGGDDLKTTGGIYSPNLDTWQDSLSYNQPSYTGDPELTWTGYEMIVNNQTNNNPGSRYNPTLNYWFDMTLEGKPERRRSPSLVWTGQELIFWGGRCIVSGCSLEKLGAIYDPIINTWRPLTERNSPTTRENHSTVWTGEKMIIWGGYLNGFLYSGGIYDLATDSWATIDESEAPRMRDHVAFWTGTEMLVWGPEQFTSVTAFANGYKFDSMTNNWTEISHVNEASFRFNYSAVWSGKEMIIWGGRGGGDLNTGASYEPSSDTWTPTSLQGAPDPMSYHDAIWTGSEMIIWSTDNNGSYNPSTNSWKEVTDHQANGDIVWADSEVFVWGDSNEYGHRLNIYVPHTELIFINSFETNVND